MNFRKILLALFVILLLAIIINYSAGTSIVINGKQVTGLGGYIAACSALVLLAVVLVVIVPSLFMLMAVLLIVFGAFFMLLFPLLPIAFLLLPGAALLGIFYIIYKLARKKSGQEK
jgi:hypothetical protein